MSRTTQTTPGRGFIRRSRAYLSKEYLPKIRRCLEELPEDDLWWRPNSSSNSVGNLILHLSGNVRQWVVSGIGGKPDRRRRGEEFAREGGLDRMELLDLLESTLDEVDGVLADLAPDLLLEERTIQGQDVSVLEALYHAVEHFSMHTGQIVYIVKMRTEVDLRFYDVEDGVARRNW